MGIGVKLWSISAAQLSRALLFPKYPLFRTNRNDTLAIDTLAIDCWFAIAKEFREDRWFDASEQKSMVRWITPGNKGIDLDRSDWAAVCRRWTQPFLASEFLFADDATLFAVALGADLDFWRVRNFRGLSTVLDPPAANRWLRFAGLIGRRLPSPHSHDSELRAVRGHPFLGTRRSATDADPPDDLGVRGHVSARANQLTNNVEHKMQLRPL